MGLDAAAESKEEIDLHQLEEAGGCIKDIKNRHTLRSDGAQHGALLQRLQSGAAPYFANNCI